MGCDIHLHVEVKINKKWHHFNNPRIERDYLLFSKLAGVRNDKPGDPWYVEPLDAPRGLPDDMAFITKLCYDREEPDAHSKSHISLKEMEDVEKWCMSRVHANDDPGLRYQLQCPFGYLLGNGFDEENLKELSEECGIEDVRAIFWFDN